jgi:hypothetical protein
MSKEERKYEIAEKETMGIFDPHELDITGLSNAMDIYAKEVAIEFFKFYIWKATGFLEYLRNVKPMVTSNEIEENLKAFEGKSLNELYELFLQSKKQ